MSSKHFKLYSEQTGYHIDRSPTKVQEILKGFEPIPVFSFCSHEQSLAAVDERVVHTKLFEHNEHQLFVIFDHDGAVFNTGKHAAYFHDL